MVGGRVLRMEMFDASPQGDLNAITPTSVATSALQLAAAATEAQCDYHPVATIAEHQSL